MRQEIGNYSQRTKNRGRKFVKDKSAIITTLRTSLTSILGKEFVCSRIKNEANKIYQSFCVYCFLLAFFIFSFFRKMELIFCINKNKIPIKITFDGKGWDGDVCKNVIIFLFI